MVLLTLTIGNALLIVFLLGKGFVSLIYALPGFPAVDIALGDSERRELAAQGMAAIRPLGPGVDLLRQAELPSGQPAFNEREVAHMEDVRRVVVGFAVAWVLGLVAAATAWFTASRGGWTGGDSGEAKRRLSRAALDASWVVLGLIALFGLLFLVAFEPIFEGFHAIFFSGDSWRFASDDTLLQLYPELFWGAAGTALVCLVVAQCLALIALARGR